MRLQCVSEMTMCDNVWVKSQNVASELDTKLISSFNYLFVVVIIAIYYGYSFYYGGNDDN